MSLPPSPDRLPNTGTVLVIDDIPSLRAIYQACLAGAGYRPIAAKSATEGLDLFRRSGAQVVLLDLFLPDRDGLDLMREMLSIRPSTAVIVVTADLSVDRAVSAMRLGAQDFLVKPVSDERLLAAIGHARASIQRSEAAVRLPSLATTQGFIGASAAIHALNERLHDASTRREPVFLWGEDGTGKDLAARTIHLLAPESAGRPFVIVDCAAIPPECFAAEVYGTPERTGLIRRAAGGTLLLRRITELDPALQTPLLAALSPPTAPRVIGTSTLSPDDALHSGRLGETLGRWLQTLPIRVPTLRERRDDIVPLARAFLQRYAARSRRMFNRFAPAAEAILQQQDWPGNVRQLMGVISAITVLHDGEAITPAMLPDDMRASERTGGPALDMLSGRTLADIERIVIEHAIARHEGSVPRAAEELEVAPSTIYRKMGIWRRD